MHIYGCVTRVSYHTHVYVCIIRVRYNGEKIHKKLEELNNNLMFKSLLGRCLSEAFGLLSYSPNRRYAF